MRWTYPLSYPLCALAVKLKGIDGDLNGLTALTARERRAESETRRDEMGTHRPS